MFKTVCLLIKTCTNATANENQIYLNDLCLQQEGDTPLFGLGTWGVFRAYLGLGLGHSGLGLESLKKECTWDLKI